MSIQKGAPIPNAKLFVLDESGAPRPIPALEPFAGKRVVLFAVPGAFTRTCSEKHLPSFVHNADAMKAKRGFFGPVITSVPTGEDAGELWDHIAWLATRDDFFEYKRSRR